MININEALTILLGDVDPIKDVDEVDVNEAHHRILAQPQRAQINVPPADISAMDGYAITRNQVIEDTPYPICQRIAAGQIAQPLTECAVARLFTGSEIPSNADTVVIQENCEQKGDSVTFLQLPQIGANIRRCGQDIIADSELLPIGRRLLAQDLGLLSSIGVEKVRCFRPLKIGVLSSGDELVEPGKTLAPGQIYNSNRSTLKGFVDGLNLIFVNLGHVPDDLFATQTALKEAANNVDVILTTGGVSVGEEDHMKSAVESLGQLRLWKLAIKPGKPLAYGNINGIPYFGLPGNPVAVFVTFLMIVRPYLLAMQGATPDNIEPLKFPCRFNVTKKSPRQEYRRVKIVDGVVSEFHTQDSGVMRSTHWANALAVIPANTTLNEGDSVDVFPFSFFNL